MAGRLVYNSSPTTTRVEWLARASARRIVNIECLCWRGGRTGHRDVDRFNGGYLWEQRLRIDSIELALYSIAGLEQVGTCLWVVLTANIITKVLSPRYYHQAFIGNRIIRIIINLDLLASI